MQVIFADIAVTVNEFTANPAAALKKADGRPIALLHHNRVAFYVLELPLLEALLEEFADLDVYVLAANRLAGKARALGVDLSDL